MPLPAESVPPPVDIGNALLGETPAQLQTALVQLPAGQRLALTVRTSSATLTVFLGKADADRWAADLTQAAGHLSKSGLVVAG